MSPGGVGYNPSELMPQAYVEQSLWVWTVSLGPRQQAMGTGLVWLTWIRVNAISKHGFSGWLSVSLRWEAGETIHPNWRWDARHSWCSYARRRASTCKWGGHKGRADEYRKQQFCGENCWCNSCDHHPQRKKWEMKKLPSCWANEWTACNYPPVQETLKKSLKNLQKLSARGFYSSSYQIPFGSQWVYWFPGLLCLHSLMNTPFMCKLILNFLSTRDP